MKNRSLGLLAALALPALVVSGLAATLLAPLSSAQCPMFEQDSYILQQDECGSVDYDLGVINYWDNAVTDFGSQWSFGSCYAGYDDCTNTWQPDGVFQAGEQFNDLGPNGPFAEDFEWNLDDYVVEGYSSCNNGNPDDQQINVVDDSFYTPVYEANNDCD